MSAQPDPTQAPSPGPIPLIGQSIGKYRIVRLIGQGGMGSVYEAQHETINQRVAVKVLHPKLTSDASSVQRFMHEARTTSLVHHAGLVKVHDFGQLPDGSAYMMMEYLEGESLKSRLAKKGPLDSKDALRIVRQLATSLSVAHEKGVIHRDLKPDNVFLVPDPETAAGERTKILDFGIAKVVDPDATELAKTNTGAIVGTPIYMSPEQCRGGITVTDRTDVYSLGIMLYQMLAGNPPFSGTGAGDLIASHIVEPPKPLREVAPHVASEVETLVHKLLLKKPEERPSMKQILGELEQLGLGATGTGAQVVIVSPPAAPTQPKRNVAPLIVGATVTIVGAIAIATILLWPKSKPVQATPGPQAQVASPPPVASPIQPQVARRVRVMLKSEPSGAKVIQVADQTALGTTPWSIERDQASAPLKVLLRLPGYADQTEVIDLADHYDRTIKLVPEPQTAEPKTPDKTNVPVQKPIALPAAKPAAKPKAQTRPNQPIRDSVDDIPVVR